MPLPENQGSLTMEERNYLKWQKVLQNKEMLLYQHKQRVQEQLFKTHKSQLSGQFAKKRIDLERIEKFKRYNEIRDKNTAKVRLLKKNAEALANTNTMFSSYSLRERPARQMKQMEREYKAMNEEIDRDDKIEEQLEYFNSRFQKSEGIVKQINESKIKIATMDQNKIEKVKSKIMNDYVTMMEERIIRLQSKYKKLKKVHKSTEITKGQVTKRHV